METFCNVALGDKVTEDYLLARDSVITISSVTDHVRVCTLPRVNLCPNDYLGINIDIAYVLKGGLLLYHQF